MQYLEFEKPLAELEKQIEEVRKVAEEQKLDVDQQIAPLQAKLGEMRADIYKNLTPLQRVQVARSARRPFTLDYLRLTGRSAESVALVEASTVKHHPDQSLHAGYERAAVFEQIFVVERHIVVAH